MRDKEKQFRERIDCGQATIIEEVEITEKAVRKNEDNTGAMIGLLNQEIEELQKAKTIVDMQNVVCKKLCNQDCRQCNYYNKNDCVQKDNVDALYEQGYRKIDKDSVVIPKEISCYENIEKRVRTFRLDGNKVDFTNEQIMALTQILHFKEKQENEIRKETAEKILLLRGYITKKFHKYHEARDIAENEYKKCKEEMGKAVLNNDWHRCDAIMFILEDIATEFDKLIENIGVEIKE